MATILSSPTVTATSGNLLKNDIGSSPISSAVVCGVAIAYPAVFLFISPAEDGHAGSGPLVYEE